MSPSSRFATTVLVVGAMVAGLTQASAETVVYDTGPAALNTGGGITTFAWANDFAFTETTRVDTMRFWVFSDEDESQDLRNFEGSLGWVIHADDAGSPGAVLFSGTDTRVSMRNTGQDTQVNGSRIYELDVDLGELKLPAGTYWFHFREGAPFSPGDATEISLTGTGQPARINGLVIAEDEEDPQFELAIDLDIAFQLLDTIGERGGLLVERFRFKDKGTNDRLKARGRLFYDGESPDLTTEEFTIVVGETRITVPVGEFEAGRRPGTFVYRSRRGDGPRVRLVVDLAKGKYSLSIRKADLGSPEGEVQFGFDFARFRRTVGQEL